MLENEDINLTTSNHPFTDCQNLHTVNPEFVNY